ncbi:MAG: DNA helicase UvrD [Candidatus Aenigmarchaeota archaeon]|nr:DNA helicase UvrD [Candidatus Aenigmarchaeota archaeon]
MDFADLHIHSHYSRATSKDMDLRHLAEGAKTKGLTILGTGDFTHPQWLKELKMQLKEAGEGIYEHGGIKWILQAEISLIYTKGGKGRRVHHLILAPSFEVVDQINAWLDKKGRRDYDGRPIFGFSSEELVESMMGISKDIMIIPAHAWTPWFSIFGSKSGFDSVEECFGDKSKFIFALETGLSSDPLMNWRVSSLDNYTLVSNSDPHSPYPWRLGREANAFTLKKTDYNHLIEAIKTKRGFEFTIEVPPEYGKYHIDGHRLCNFSTEPSKRNGDRCPKCQRQLTIGVLARVEELADRPDGFIPKEAVPFKSLLPLAELIAAATGYGVASKKAMELYSQLITRFGNEFSILLEAGERELAKTIPENLARLIIKNRQGKIKIEPGYDGVYGKPVLNSGKESTLGEFVR